MDEPCRSGMLTLSLTCLAQEYLLTWIQFTRAQPHTVQVEVEYLGSPSKLSTQYGDAERAFVTVADASGQATIGF